MESEKEFVNVRIFIYLQILLLKRVTELMHGLCTHELHKGKIFFRAFNRTARSIMLSIFDSLGISVGCADNFNFFWQFLISFRGVSY